MSRWLWPNTRMQADRLRRARSLLAFSRAARLRQRMMRNPFGASCECQASDLLF